MKRMKYASAALAALLLLTACSGDPGLPETDYLPLSHRLAYEYRADVVAQLRVGVEVSEIDPLEQLADLCLDLAQYAGFGDDADWILDCQHPEYVYNPHTATWGPAE